MERIQAELERFGLVILIGLPLALVLTTLGGFLLTRRLLKPISYMTETASRITAENLNERLPVENPGDELGRLALAFNETFSRLDRTFYEMKRFTADASHELRTPLTVIRTVGEVALREKHTDAGYRDIISNILEESDRLRHLVESLLTLSRADAGQVAISVEKCDMVDLCEGVVAHLGVLAEEKGQKLEIQSEGPVFASIDAKIVRQALINIVHNAIKYAGESARIVIKIFNRSNHPVIEISDNGPGIASEHHLKLFDRFYRVDSGRSRNEGGTGLGLSIARWGVEASGGRIELESEPGKGSTFRIVLSESLQA
jgi:heavy metal sensor kinase